MLFRSEVDTGDGARYGIGYIRNGDILNHDGGMDGTRSSVMLDLTTKKAGCAVATLENLTPKLAPKIDEIGPEKHYDEIQKLRANSSEKLIETYQKMNEAESKESESHKEIGQKLVESGVELKETFVEKLGLSEKGKPRSFVEAATAGKYGNIGSKGGAHEL